MAVQCYQNRRFDSELLIAGGLWSPTSSAEQWGALRYYDDEGAMHEERVKTARDTYSGFYEEPYETVVHGTPQLVAPEATVAQLRILEDTTSDLR